MFRLGRTGGVSQPWQCAYGNWPLRRARPPGRFGTTRRRGCFLRGVRANGYRVYDDHHVRLVREIRSLQAIGFSLQDVRPFVECLLAGHETGDDCPASVDVYRRKLAYLERHIAELSDVRDRLSERLADLGDIREEEP